MYRVQCITSVSFVQECGFKMDKAMAVVSDRHLAEMAPCIMVWEYLAPHLCISDPEIVEIKKDDNGFYAQQKISCLRKWKEIAGDRATYLSLMRAALKCGQEDLVQYMVEIPGIGDELQEDKSFKEGEPSVGTTVSIFSCHL